jgi:hypothetical protein
MGRRDDFKGTPIHDSRHLKRWDENPERQDSIKTAGRDVQRAIQDVELAERHAGFDEQAKDNTMKYERPSFSVVGECSKSADDNYRRNYPNIDWSN